MQFNAKVCNRRDWSLFFFVLLLGLLKEMNSHFS